MTAQHEQQSAGGSVWVIRLLLLACAGAVFWFADDPSKKSATQSEAADVVADAGNDASAEDVPKDVAAAVTAAAPEPVLPSDQGADGGSDEASNDAPAPEAEPTEQPEADIADAQEGVQDDAEDPETAPLGFDVVRVQPDGSGLVAGFAPSGDDVLILVDGLEIARAQADQQGKFVALFDLPMSDTARSLTLGLEDELGKVEMAKASVLVAPVQVTDIAQAEDQIDDNDAADAPTTEIASLDEPQSDVELAAAGSVSDSETSAAEATTVTEVATVQAQNEAPSSPTTPSIEATAGTLVRGTDPAPERTASAAPTIVMADETGVTVLQAAPRPAVPSSDAQTSDETTEVAANVVIDTIEYNANGEVVLAGRGAPDADIRVYLNDQLVQSTDVTSDENWVTALSDIDAGLYRLRIDEVSEDGTVTSRVETPFRRDQLALAAGNSGVITVQSGFTLWAIAEANFGDGAKYVRVYEANRDLIRDPDLIYPGQVFQIPAEIEIKTEDG